MSIVWPDGRVGVPWERCCSDPKPKDDGDCSDGCCTYYRCESCKKRWKYEWPD